MVVMGIAIGEEIEERTTGTEGWDEDWTVAAVEEDDGDNMTALPALLLLLPLPLLAILRSFIMPGSRLPLLVLPFDDSILLGVVFKSILCDKSDPAPSASAGAGGGTNPTAAAGGSTERSIDAWLLTFNAAPS